MNIRKNRKRKNYMLPKVKKYKLDDLSKGWNLAALDIEASCKGTCIE
jgi:hypothetical protein